MRRLLVLLVASLVLAAPARAATPEIGIADDRILLPGGPAADRAVAEWSALGVDTVRIFAHWGRIAPPRPPRDFRAADPTDRTTCGRTSTTRSTACERPACGRR